MHDPHLYPESEAVVGVGIGILFTILTCGIYGLFWQYREIDAVNAWLGREELNFGNWLLLTILTCGLFALYYDYKMAQAINEVQRLNGLHVNEDLAILCVLLSLCGLSFVSLALRQNAINAFYGSSRDF